MTSPISRNGLGAVPPHKPFTVHAVAAAAMLSMVQLATAQTPNSADLGETVVVVGTTRTDITALQSTAPVDQFSREQLEATGAVNLSEALQRLSPSLHFPQGAVSPMGAGNPRSISLRGLSPELTLVLVNGKRQVASANVTTGTPPVYAYGSQTVDMQMIPLSAVERVEVLRDGASAQYGSDAIAGVVNVILKKRPRGGQISASYGEFSRRADKPTTGLQGWHGFALPGQGHLTLGFDIEHSAHAPQGLPNQNINYFATNASGQPVLVNSPLPLPAGLTPDPREDAWDRSSHLWGYPPSIRSYALFANAAWSPSEAWEVYAFGTAGYNRKRAGTNHTTAASNQNVRELFPDGIDPFTIVTSEQLTGAVGAKYFEESVGSFDLSLNAGRFVKSTLSAPTVNASFGVNSPTSLETGGGDNRLAALTLDWVKDIPVSWLRSPLTLSAGAGLRHERFENVAGEYHSWADGGVLILDGPNAGRFPQLPSGIRPEEATTVSRSVRSLYVQAEGSLNNKVEGGVALRAENYSDFGSASSVRGSVRYEFVPAFALRATLGTGYRAPSLGQINYTTGSGGVQPLTGVTVKNKGFPVDHEVAKALGAQALKPERSVNLSLGAVWRQAPEHSLVVDLFAIDIKDRIALSDDFNVADPIVAALLAPYRDIQIARFFTNGFDVRSYGIDLVQKSRLQLGAAGSLDLTLGYSRVTNKVRNVRPNTVTGRDRLVNLQAIWSIEDYAPRDKLIASAAYRLGALTSTVAVRRYGSYSESLSATAPTIQTFSPQWVSDLDFVYRFGNGVHVGLGAKNLFDSRPDEQIYPQNSRLLQTNYSNLSPEGFSGRFVYVKGGVTF